LLITINDENVYPTDLERKVEAAFPMIIRPGSTVAFQSPYTARICFEIRNAAASKKVQPSSKQIQSLLKWIHQVDIDAVFVLRQRFVQKLEIVDCGVLTPDIKASKIGGRQAVALLL